MNIKRKLVILFLNLIKTIILSLILALFKNMLSYCYEATLLASFFTPFFVAFMDGFPSSGCGSSSHQPQSDPTQAPADPTPPPAEPVAPEVDHPLLDDNTRREELNERAGIHFQGVSQDRINDILDSQVKIDKAIEKALLSDGYSRDELSEKNTRNTIRGYLFYPRGHLMTVKKYREHVEQIEFGTHRSEPYKWVINAISSSKLRLTRVKKIKKCICGQDCTFC